MIAALLSTLAFANLKWKDLRIAPMSSESECILFPMSDYLSMENVLIMMTS